MRKTFWRLTLAAIWAIGSLANPSSANAEDAPRYREVTYYYVAGVTKGGPVRSESYRDQAQAARVMANWQREHAAGGLLEADPFIEGPAIRTETLRERVSPPAPDRPAAPPPFEPQRPSDRPGETGTAGTTNSTTEGTPTGGPDLWKGLKEKQWVDVPDRITGNPNGPPPKTDKDQQFIGTFTGTEGGSAVTFQFLANGDVIAKDKDGEWKGKWVSFGENQIKIELTSPNAIEYEGKLENGKLTGRGRNRMTGQSWDVELSSPHAFSESAKRYQLSDLYGSWYSRYHDGKVSDTRNLSVLAGEVVNSNGDHLRASGTARVDGNRFEVTFVATKGRAAGMVSRKIEGEILDANTLRVTRDSAMSLFGVRIDTEIPPMVENASAQHPSTWVKK